MRARNFFQFRFHAREFVGQDRFQEIDLAWEMRIESFFANAQFVREIIHGHAAKSVTKEMRSRGIDDALSDRDALTGMGSNGAFHRGNQISLFGFLDNKNPSREDWSANHKGIHTDG